MHPGYTAPQTPACLGGAGSLPRNHGTSCPLRPKGPTWAPEPLRVHGFHANTYKTPLSTNGSGNLGVLQPGARRAACLPLGARSLISGGERTPTWGASCPGFGTSGPIVGGRLSPQTRSHPQPTLISGGGGRAGRPHLPHTSLPLCKERKNRRESRVSRTDNIHWSQKWGRDRR